MKFLTMAAACLALTVMMATGPSNEAKADGGAAVAIGVGAYLIVDAIVGHRCQRRDWPFNTIAKIADELRGRKGCYRYYGSYKDRYHKYH